jgi:Type III secretion system lipoprotein chaperone (YscW)
MSIGRILLGTMLIAIILAVPAVALAQTTTTINGSVTFSGATPVATDILLVQLYDHKGIKLVETQPAVGGKAPPYNYTLSIDSSRIRSGGSYQVVAQLGTANRDLLYLGRVYITIKNTSVAAPPLTMGRRVGRLSDTGSGALVLLAGLTLAALAGFLWMWHWQRMRAPVRRLA